MFPCINFDLDQKVPFKDSLVTEGATKEALGMKEMTVPLCAGILSALRRVVARRVSLKGSSSDISIKLPISLWAYSSVILFGIILIFYVDNIAEERLHMVFSSPRHLMVAGGCIIVMEIMYKMDFSLPGIFEATSLERIKKDAPQPLDMSDGAFETQNQGLSLPK
ncbi:hypothetical protein C5167_033510 [Papaver somniferum]|uniref:Uncharacterized protein n=1 Tax=Papaver somniferum TaxID=3469 RepID=A0A4Y7KA40_PAPSO|nr:hypothetical protein C5167_033510 [Papaver somniferum]